MEQENSKGGIEMEILKEALGEMFIRFGNNETVVAFSQYVDEMIVKELLSNKGEAN